jgi:hypothetical protein
MRRASDEQILRQAENLARSGDFSNWRAIEVELRCVGYQLAPDLFDNERTRERLDQLCAEAREIRRHP